MTGAVSKPPRYVVNHIPSRLLNQIPPDEIGIPIGAPPRREGDLSPNSAIPKQTYPTSDHSKHTTPSLYSAPLNKPIWHPGRGMSDWADFNSQISPEQRTHGQQQQKQQQINFRPMQHPPNFHAPHGTLTHHLARDGPNMNTHLPHLDKTYHHGPDNQTPPHPLTGSQLPYMKAIYDITLPMMTDKPHTSQDYPGPGNWSGQSSRAHKHEHAKWNLPRSSPKPPCGGARQSTGHSAGSQ